MTANDPRPLDASSPENPGTPTQAPATRQRQRASMQALANGLSAEELVSEITTTLADLGSGRRTPTREVQVKLNACEAALGRRLADGNVEKLGQRSPMVGGLLAGTRRYQRDSGMFPDQTLHEGQTLAMCALISDDPDVRDGYASLLRPGELQTFDSHPAFGTFWRAVDTGITERKLAATLQGSYTTAMESFTQATRAAMGTDLGGGGLGV